MGSLRVRWLRTVFASLLALAPLAVLGHADEAQASVSIAVGFDALVKDSDVVAVVSPQEHTCVWEDGRIYTYTRVKVEQGVAGDLGAGGEGWVRTMGGVVGKIGQLVDGEAVFAPGKSSLIFLRRYKSATTFEVSARAQGQYPIFTDDVSKARKLVRSGNVGVLFPPKPKLAEATAEPGQVQTQSVVSSTPTKIVLAQETLHDRPIEEATREIASAWKRLHPAAK